MLRSKMPRKRPTSKRYHGPRGKRTPTKSGAVARSGFEAKVVDDLTDRGVAHEYEPRDKRLTYTTTHRYLPDVVLSNGTIIEVKGYWAPEDRTKLQAILKDNPDADIRMLFQRSTTTLSRTSRTTYAEWCDKRDIPYAVGTVPEEWIK